MTQAANDSQPGARLNYMSKFLGSLVIALALAGCAESRTCSIQLAVATPQTEFQHIAQISRAAAEQSVRERLQSGRAGRIVSANLEAESGCLIWSVKMSMLGELGLSDVHVDAGDGRVLLVQHETDTGQADPTGTWFYE